MFCSSFTPPLNPYLAAAFNETFAESYNDIIATYGNLNTSAIKLLQTRIMSLQSAL